MTPFRLKLSPYSATRITQSNSPCFTSVSSNSPSSLASRKVSSWYHCYTTLGETLTVSCWRCSERRNPSSHGNPTQRQAGLAAESRVLPVRCRYSCLYRLAEYQRPSPSHRTGDICLWAIIVLKSHNHCPFLTLSLAYALLHLSISPSLLKSLPPSQTL